MHVFFLIGRRWRERYTRRITPQDAVFYVMGLAPRFDLYIDKSGHRHHHMRHHLKPGGRLRYVANAANRVFMRQCVAAHQSPGYGGTGYDGTPFDEASIQSTSRQVSP